MNACHWFVADYRRCKRGGFLFLADLRLCTQHQKILLDALHHAIRRPQDTCDQEIRAAVERALENARGVEILAERERQEAARRARSVVYFVERGGFVKIGHTSGLKQRLQAISTGSCLIEGMTVGPVRLLATIERAGRSNEDWLHRRFDHLRVGGEWFLPDPELRAFIAGLKGFCGWPASMLEAA